METVLILEGPVHWLLLTDCRDDCKGVQERSRERPFLSAIHVVRSIVTVLNSCHNELLVLL